MSDFDTYLASIFGADLPQFLNHGPIPKMVRANPLKIDPQTLPKTLGRYGIKLEPHPIWDGMVWQVASAPKGRGPGGCLHHFLGGFAVQSLGSMVPPLLLEPKPGERILDLCAAPGSKTRQIAAMMNGQGWIWANEMTGRRMNPLAAMMDANGAPCVALINRDGSILPKFVLQPFDRVLADVPCTGLGCHAHLRQNRSYFKRRGGPTRLPDLQYRLLLSAFKLTKVGGRIVYSTCSLDPIENEAIVDAALRRLPLRLITPKKLPGLTLREGRTRHGPTRYDPSLALARRLTPYENPTEGFFVAVLEKTGETPDALTAKLDTNKASATTPTSLASEVEPILEELRQTYGLDEALFKDWRYLARPNHITMVPSNIEHVWAGAMRAGASLGKHSIREWRLSDTAIQRFGHHITKNRIELSRAQLEQLSATGTCTLPKKDEPTTKWPVLSAQEVGGGFTRGIWLNDQLRWKLPRRYALPDL